MHGLTGGSEMNYIKALMQEASLDGYKSVCMNSRGINSNMTSPIPFTACEHGELETALDRVEHHYPNSPIYMVGTSFGGNYLMRYLSKYTRSSIGGLIALAPPIDVRRVVKEMPFIYQHFFVKRYIYEIVTKHPEMNFWEDIGICDMSKIKKSKTLEEFHYEATCKILGLENTDELFKMYTLTENDIQSIKVPTYMMVSKDDPIVSYETMPLETIKSNKNINLVVTERGGHLCWFEGMIPKRWYPRPALDYLKSLSRAEQV
jgi:uncharacterized protein